MKSKGIKSDYTKHHVFQDTEMIQGYKLTNETTESETRIINTIKIIANLSSSTGNELYQTIKDKFTPGEIKAKYITSTNYIYGEKKQDDIITIEIKIVTDKTNEKEVKAKKKLLQKINKYT